jgi:hypothetical protein
MIRDRFTDLPISRQRKYQLRQLALRRCPKCGCPSMPDIQMCKDLLCCCKTIWQKAKQSNLKCSGQWTPSKKRSFIVSALRRASCRWRPKNDVKKNARVGRNQYKCAMCSVIVGNKDAKVDHIAPCVPVTGWDDYDGFIQRLFVEVDGLRVLCVECHDKVTTEQKQVRKQQKTSSAI